MLDTQVIMSSGVNIFKPSPLEIDVNSLHAEKSRKHWRKTLENYAAEHEGVENDRVSDKHRLLTNSVSADIF